MAGRPYVAVFSTATLDGRIASSTGYSMLSCRYDLARLRLLRGAADAVMIGASTALIDDPSLRRRLRPRTPKYLRVVVDGSLRVHPGLRLFREPGPSVVVFTASRDEQRIRALERAGATVYSVPAAAGGSRVDLEEALRILYERHGVERLLVEGGGVLNYSLAASGLVDEIRVTYTPHVFAAGRSFFDDPDARGFPDTSSGPRLSLVCVETCPCGRCVHAAYRVENPAPGAAAPGLLAGYCLSSLLEEVVEE